METVETPVPPLEPEAELNPEEIRKRAYELSLQHPKHSPMDNWLCAGAPQHHPDVRLHAPVARVSRRT